MPGTVVLDILDALVREYTAAVPPSVIVYDGTGISEDPSNFVMVGVGDPDSDQPPTSAESEQEWAGLGAKRGDEEGTITCCAVAWNGESEGLAQARADLRSMLDAMSAVHLEDPTLGVGPVMWTRFGGRTSTTQIQATDGSSIVHYFEIKFKARI